MTKGTIDKILDELAMTDQMIRKYRESAIMPDIEKDIVLAKLRTIYEFILLIPSEKIAKTDFIFEPLITKETPRHKVEIETISPQKEKTDDNTPEKEDPIHKTKFNKQEQKNVKPPVLKKPQNTDKKTEVVLKTEILADTFEKKSFLNEALAQYKNMFDISKKMQNQPLRDIFLAINLNDKYLFIKELFNNDASLYQNTIEKLNTSADFNEAVQYLDQYFTWDFDAEQVQKLLELVRRRYIPANES